MKDSNLTFRRCPSWKVSSSLSSMSFVFIILTLILASLGNTPACGEAFPCCNTFRESFSALSIPSYIPPSRSASSIMFWLSCMFIIFHFLPFFSFHFFYLQKPLYTSAISNLSLHVRTFEVKIQKHFAVLLLKKIW